MRVKKNIKRVRKTLDKRAAQGVNLLQYKTIEADIKPMQAHLQRVGAVKSDRERGIRKWTAEGGEEMRRRRERALCGSGYDGIRQRGIFVIS